MSTTTSGTVTVRTASIMAGGAAALVLASVAVTLHVARATPGGATKPALAFSGTLRQNGQPMTGPQEVTFSFKKAGSSACAPKVTVTPDSVSGAFSTLVPIDTCPPTLFDGSDVVVDYLVGATMVATDQPVAAVPYAKYADQVGVPDCPVGYAKTGPAAAFLSASIVCVKGKDQVVKVGTGASAFWIDRYEASVWTTAAGAAQIADNNNAAYATAGLPNNGQTKTPLYALSVADVMPSRSLTWFQAVEACAASGKELADDLRWLRAGRGTYDPTSDNPGLQNKKCNTKDTGPRQTNAAIGNTWDGSCVSDWGAEDMIGNLLEWTAEWHMGPMTSATGVSATPWPAGEGYGGDGTWGITSFAHNNVEYKQGAPAVAPGLSDACRPWRGAGPSEPRGRMLHSPA
jgi:hypothetical protein